MLSTSQDKIVLHLQSILCFFLLVRGIFHFVFLRGSLSILKLNNIQIHAEKSYIKGKALPNKETFYLRELKLKTVS